MSLYPTTTTLSIVLFYMGTSTFENGYNRHTASLNGIVRGWGLHVADTWECSNGPERTAANGVVTCVWKHLGEVTSRFLNGPERTAAYGIVLCVLKQPGEVTSRCSNRHGLTAARGPNKFVYQQLKLGGLTSCSGPERTAAHGIIARVVRQLSEVT